MRFLCRLNDFSDFLSDFLKSLVNGLHYFLGMDNLLMLDHFLDFLLNMFLDSLDNLLNKHLVLDY